jgi:hypothetical protein
MIAVTIIRTGARSFEWRVVCQFYSATGVSGSKHDAWLDAMEQGRRTWSDSDRAWSDKPAHDL